MKLKLRNIKPGYAEVWLNGRAGERYVKIGVMQRDDGYRDKLTRREIKGDRRWRWSIASDYEQLIPNYTYDFATRRECWLKLRRTAFKRAALDAIEKQSEPSQHWHCPRRDAFADMWDSGVFTLAELEDMHERMEVYG